MKKFLVIVLFIFILSGCETEDVEKGVLTLDSYAFYDENKLKISMFSSIEIEENTVFELSINRIEGNILETNINSYKLELTYEFTNGNHRNGNIYEVVVESTNSTDDYSISGTFSLKAIYVLNHVDMDDYVKFYGRSYDTEQGIGRAMNYSASGLEFSFFGTMVDLYFNIPVSVYKPVFNIYIDGEFYERFTVSSTAHVTMVNNLDLGKHTFKIVKCSEYSQSLTFVSIITTDGQIFEKVEEAKLKFEVYGDSISCGYGILGNFADSWDPTKTYAYLMAEEYNADINFITYSGWGAYISPYATPKTNGAVSRLFSITDLYLNTPWDFTNYKADFVMVNLGTNDGWEIGSNQTQLAEFKRVYKKLIMDIDDIYKNPLIVCMVGMMTKTSAVNNTIEQIVSELSQENILFLQARTMLSSEKGYEGHPNYVAHEEVYNQLSQFVEGKIGA